MCQPIAERDGARKEWVSGDGAPYVGAEEHKLVMVVYSTLLNPCKRKSSLWKTFPMIVANILLMSGGVICPVERIFPLFLLVSAWWVKSSTTTIQSRITADPLTRAHCQHNRWNFRFQIFHYEADQLLDRASTSCTSKHQRVGLIKSMQMKMVFNFKS